MKVLIIDDESSIRQTTRVALTAEGHEVLEASTGEEALKMLRDEPIDIAFLDLRLGGEDGMELMPRLLEASPYLDVIILTAFGTIETAVNAVKAGAAEFMTKPFTPEQMRQTLKRLGEKRRLAGKVESLKQQLYSESPGVDLTTEEPLLKQVYQEAAKAANSAATIMVLGESGTGKSILARAIHDKSPNRENEFVTVSCPSLSRELLESELFGHIKGSFTGAVKDTWGKVAQAEGGTLFLDEIGELPMEIQPKLLRLLQEREYERLGENKTRKANVRVIAATNQNLEQAVKEGRFREDLYYRLNVISLKLPPLRERRADLLRMADTYLKFFVSQSGKSIQGFSEAARNTLMTYSWKGNLRELRNVIERAVILAESEWIEPGDLPATMTDANSESAGAAIVPGQQVSLKALEKEHIRRILDSSDTMDQAARILEIDPATLYRKRKRLFPDEFKSN